MSPLVITLFVIGYFATLMFISYLTSKGESNNAFFLGNKKSPWYVVAFGMIGASLSGVTFISVPGWVGSSAFSYMQMVVGYLVGYLVIGTILLPLYYKLNLTSIYSYLGDRLGEMSYKIGSFYFILSRTIGASFRLYLVAMVFQFAIFDQLNIDIPFIVTVAITILLIWLYTFKGGIKTIIYTDTLQTFFMLASVIITIWVIASSMDLNLTGLATVINESDYSKTFVWDWTAQNNFFKQFLSGAFIAIVMTGLDQDMMQKNLTCKSIRDAQKNMFWFSIVLVFANLLFLSLGALLYIYSESNGILLPEKADQLFPMLALEGHLPWIVGVFFILGLIAAAYSSADSALTSLTTSFCVDFLNISSKDESLQILTRRKVHIAFSIVLVLVIMLFRLINDESVISELFTVAGYTYGPLLGLFSFGLFTKYKVKDKFVPLICLMSPLICYVLKVNSDWMFGGYKFGFELLILNGLITFLGLFLVREKLQFIQVN